MEHPIHAVTWFEIVGEFTLRVGFADGTEQVIDFGALLRGRIFGPLRHPAVFNAVAIDPDARTLVWPNGADFDPAILHDWPDRESDMRELVERW